MSVLYWGMSFPVNNNLSTPSSLMTAIRITPPELPSRDIASATPTIINILISPYYHVWFILHYTNYWHNIARYNTTLLKTFSLLWYVCMYLDYLHISFLIINPLIDSACTHTYCSSQNQLSHLYSFHSYNEHHSSHINMYCQSLYRKRNDKTGDTMKRKCGM